MTFYFGPSSSPKEGRQCELGGFGITAARRSLALKVGGQRYADDISPA